MREVDLKENYGVYIRGGFLGALIFFILIFLFVPEMKVKPYKLKKDIVTIVEEVSTQLERFIEPPKMERPKVAIEAESEEEATDATIASTEFEEVVIPTRHTGPEVEAIPFFRVEVKPKLIYSPPPKYPESARELGITGTTVIQAVVDVDGSVINPVIIKSSGSDILDMAALNAVKKYKFTPGRQRDKYVRVRVQIPIVFKLK
ncbi:hypothetical protein DRP53_05055 [candidate division WOR-3 bacterium]|uniref:TonB C-terminal domain-containing protein n=1 Tax=candidate division WOR-3 bacterium TaxID=2052148 RepID=A0A660SHV0_UNCW3|nr:MAG: hypothetical protein DRP53_05055 [candidate division WOR-3 bacterium]